MGGNTSTSTEILKGLEERIENLISKFDLVIQKNKLNLEESKDGEIERQIHGNV